MESWAQAPTSPCPAPTLAPVLCLLDSCCAFLPSLPQSSLSLAQLTFCTTLCLFFCSPFLGGHSLWNTLVSPLPNSIGAVHDPEEDEWRQRWPEKSQAPKQDAQSPSWCDHSLLSFYLCCRPPFLNPLHSCHPEFLGPSQAWPAGTSPAFIVILHPSQTVL